MCSNDFRRLTSLTLRATQAYTADQDVPAKNEEFTRNGARLRAAPVQGHSLGPARL